MNLQKLFAMQDILDQKIRKEHGLERADLFNDKILALYVEVAELANETRCFKYWSHKPSSPREVILEEYVDGFHFLLSLGLECGFADDIPDFFAIENGEKDVTGLFLEFIHGSIDLKNDGRPIHTGIYSPSFSLSGKNSGLRKKRFSRHMWKKMK